MDDDTETAEPADETEVAPDAPEPEAEPEPVAESVEVVGGQPEPTPVGHQVVQDNVSEPGRQVTRTPEGEVTSATEADPF